MLRNEAKKHLEEVIIPFWSKLRDDRYGGYFGLVDSDLNIYKKFTKGVILNSRILWFFSNAYLTLGKEACLDQARHAYAFLKDCCLDKENGGVFWSLRYNGDIEDSTKHTYNIAFAIYALSTYYDASKEEEAIEIAEGLYKTIETKCRDEIGYLEAFTKDFQPESNEKLSENGIVASKTMNTLLHVFEAYTEFYRVTGKTEVKEKIFQILDQFADKVYNKELCRQEVFFDGQFHSLIDLHSYGHDIETAWLIDRGCEILGEKKYIEKMAPITKALTQNIYDTAFHKNSLWNECENGVPDKTRVWWVQAEAVLGFLNGYEKDRERTDYLDAAKGIWNYIQEHFVDKRPGSEWFWLVNDEGESVEVVISDKEAKSFFKALGEIKDNRMVKPIVEPWKCPYHNGRMCMEILRRNLNV
ncbi:AGE family epimerase/isomerase [[Clostridium] polysaccharolyticum]|uniref:Cellobiose 2-epimerase n=1 Tax=[Clostridium] polysaccharolyticum TaxID=29364 RepID=A0A1I0F514_9FIRM|nr:AGE family epimerase/isomerase [[Clostridium] polysaccharolyticum]SET52502.1 mannobiose 2-epimerase [[Clostridium] polysaccharolyticum]